MEKVLWPSWRFGPNGEAEVFEAEADVPAGWTDHPSKVTVEPEEAPKRRGRPPKPVVDEGDF
jgi:hypothetical protein